MPLGKDNKRDSFKAVSHSRVGLGWTPNTIRSWDL